MRISIRIAVFLPLFVSCGLVSSAQAQSCDDACFLIQNTFVQETLKRYVKAFPDGRYVDLAKSRLGYLDTLDRGQVSAFGPIHVVPATTVPAAKMPSIPLN